VGAPKGVQKAAFFSGENMHTLDEKSRLAVPAKFRAHASLLDGQELWIVTKGFEACLVLFTGESWQAMQDKLAGLTMGNREHRIFVRNFVGPAVELAADKQGRICIPQPLREHAAITKDVVVVGVGKYIEIWDKDAYEHDLRKNGDLGAIGETLARLDI
jgi:MraZ protein